MERNLERMFSKKDGILRTRDFISLGFGYRDVVRMLEKGEIERLGRGLYQRVDMKRFSETRAISGIYPEAVVCLESALFVYGYTDRTPLSWHIAVKETTSRRGFGIPWPSVTPHFVKNGRFALGATSMKIDGSNVRIYDRERTICDCLRNRNRMDTEVFNQAIISYVRDPHKDVSRLASYARQLGVERKVREIIDIWL